MIQSQDITRHLRGNIPSTTPVHVASYPSALDSIADDDKTSVSELAEDRTQRAFDSGFLRSCRSLCNESQLKGQGQSRGEYEWSTGESVILFMGPTLPLK